jgi:hypothetical protein
MRSSGKSSVVFILPYFQKAGFLSTEAKTAPPQLCEEPFWIPPCVATASAYEQTCFMPFPLAPLPPEACQ